MLSTTTKKWLFHIALFLSTGYIVHEHMSTVDTSRDVHQYTTQVVLPAIYPKIQHGVPIDQQYEEIKNRINENLLNMPTIQGGQ